MKIVKKQNKVLLAMALLFIAPGLMAYLCYSHPQWLSSKATNRGVLLKPAIALPSLSREKKWGLVLWSPQGCDLACKQELDQLGRIRLALGRHLYLLNQWLLTEETAKRLPEEKVKALKDHAITWLKVSKKESDMLSSLNNNSRVFITDPNGYPILAYSSSAKPSDIFHDLKILLNTSGNKRG